MATLIALAVVALSQLVGLSILSSLAIMFFTWIISVAMAAYLKSKFSGLTGDTYGAINEVAEVGVLVLLNLLVQVGLA